MKLQHRGFFHRERWNKADSEEKGKFSNQVSRTTWNLKIFLKLRVLIFQSVKVTIPWYTLCVALTFSCSESPRPNHRYIATRAWRRMLLKGTHFSKKHLDTEDDRMQAKLSSEQVAVSAYINLYPLVVTPLCSTLSIVNPGAFMHALSLHLAVQGTRANPSCIA